MKFKTIMITFAILIVAAVVIVAARNMMMGNSAGYSTYGSQDTLSLANSGSGASSGDVQVVKMKLKGYQYILEPATVKVGQKVRIEADIKTMFGCMRSINIPAFGVSKYVSEEDNIVEFTPTRSGTFNIMCSMNMGRGTITVIEADGTKSNAVDTAKPAGGGSCGAGGGGCGCGGGR